MPQQLDEMELYKVKDVLRECKEDDADKRDFLCKMADVTFASKDAQETTAEDKEERSKTKTKLKVWMTIPDKEKGGRIKLDFCMTSLKQFLMGKLGIPYQYILKCPATLAMDNVNYWKAAFADKDLLIRARMRGPESYARGVLAATYGKIDNTPIMRMVDGVAKEADLSVWRYDIPDESFHVKLLFPQHVNMGTKAAQDNVHLGLHLASSEVGLRMFTVDMMTFRLVCTNGAIALVNGERLVKYQHHGDLSMGDIADTLRSKVHDALGMSRDVFGKMQATKDVRPADIFEEARRVWDQFHLRKEIRDVAFEFLTQKYPSGTKWDLVNAMTELAQTLADEPTERVKIEEAAGQYMLMDKLLSV